VTPGAEPTEPTDLASALAALAADDPRARTLAAKALGRQGPDVREAAPHLMRALADADPMVRSMAASALGKIGAPQAAPALVAALSDPVVPVRFWVAEALGRLGVDAPGAREALARLAAESEPHVKAAATRALAFLGRPGEGFRHQIPPG
jgi:HEAT repeat protein